MRKKILIALAVIAVVLGAFAAVVAMQPSDLHISRSASIEAPPSEVFAVVNNFHNWEDWSPWVKRDPNAKNTYEGPNEGVGAIFKWSGNDEVGEGMMTLTESQPSDRVGIKLEFIRPFPDTADVEFTFKPDGDRTVVTWAMDGEQRFIEKAICMFMDMDEMVGGDFDEGLANLKSVVESKESGSPETPSQEETPVSPEQPSPTAES